jgi:hypothetical protein
MANGFTEDRQAAQERVERAQQAEDERRSNAERTVDETLAARDQVNVETERFTTGVKPTPTQRECDLMKLGVPIDEKEPSGAPPEAEFQRRMLEARLPGNSPYETRAGSGSGPSEPPKRGPGRPPKSESPPPL